jgi:dTDP-4-dehydrorhamnose reductase
MDMKKIFLTGSNGLLGSSIQRILNLSGECEIISLKHHEILCIESSELREYLVDVDWIIHCAAQTNVEQCEKEPETCYVNNCFLTEKIISCSRLNSKILYVSSTGVYGNHEIRPYHEYDRVNPTTVHHRSKHLAEAAVLSKNADNIIVRTGWLFGDLSKNDFVSKIMDQAKKSPKTINSNNQQIGCPSYAQDVAKVCIELLQVGAYGVFNAVNAGSVSRYGYVSRIIRNIRSETAVNPVKSNFFKRTAQVSDNEAAVSVRLALFGVSSLRSWEEALDDFLGSTSSAER